jgi:hypothetical protein
MTASAIIAAASILKIAVKTDSLATICGLASIISTSVEVSVFISGLATENGSQ